MTFTVNEKEPAVVGVPVIAPVEEFRVNPAANVPELIDHTYGAVPFWATSVNEYGSPTVPFGIAVAVILSGAGLTVTVTK